MARLRASTAAAHDRIERNPRLAALLSPDLTAEQYRDVLIRYHAYFARVEPGLLASLRDVVPASDLEARRKLPLLGCDLATPGVPIPAPEPPPLSGTLSVAQALGRFYVHEGASLGGRLLHAALQRNLGPGLGSCRFFEGYGRRTAEIWRRTQAILETGLNGEPEIREAAEAANAAFQEIDCIMAADFVDRSV